MIRRVILIVLGVVLLWTWNIVRHEGSHAAVAWAEGATIVEVRLFPGYRADGGSYFGYARWRGSTTWLTTAAPYLVAVIIAIIGWLWARPRRVAVGRKGIGHPLQPSSRPIFGLRAIRNGAHAFLTV